jgi:hypothetical protein
MDAARYFCRFKPTDLFVYLCELLATRSVVVLPSRVLGDLPQNLLVKIDTPSAPWPTPLGADADRVETDIDGGGNPGGRPGVDLAGVIDSIRQQNCDTASCAADGGRVVTALPTTSPMALASG